MACKVSDKSERGSTGILGAFCTFFISVTGVQFPIWTEDKIRPAYRASPVTGLIWIGPDGPIYGGKLVLQNQLGLYLAGNLRLKLNWASLLLYASTKV